MLYVDLIENTRNSVEAVISLLTARGKGKDSRLVAGSKSAQSIGLAQSSVLCIDLICQHLGDRAKAAWVDKLEGCLELVISLLARTSAVIEASALPSSSSSQKSSSSEVIADEGAVVELMKLQGSVILCAASLCATVGPKALAKLSVSLFLSNAFTAYLTLLNVQLPFIPSDSGVPHYRQHRPAPSLSEFRPRRVLSCCLRPPAGLQ